jgi:hypothetical protein
MKLEQSQETLPLFFIEYAKDLRIIILRRV